MVDTVSPPLTGARTSLRRTPDDGPRPRWEWRFFRHRMPRTLSTAVHVTASGPITAETYIVAPASTFNVKVREGRLEIKRLERIDEHGLEQWRPIHKLAFPLTPADADTVCVNLGVPNLELDAPVAVDAFLDRMRALAPAVTVVPLLKQRSRFELQGCSGEFVSLVIGRDRWESFAIEGEDSSAVHAALKALHLDDVANISYPQALKYFCHAGNLVRHPLPELG